MIVDNVEKALIFAQKAHEGQLRKYTGEPYFNHPYEVSLLVLSVTSDEDMIIAALLHDVVEDTSHTIEDIRQLFGNNVAKLVFWLTDSSKLEDGNRAIRKKIDRLHIQMAPPEAKTIKLADLIHNTSSIVEHDPKFAKIYMEEKKLLLEVLSDGDPGLFERAKGLVNDYFA